MKNLFLRQAWTMMKQHRLFTGMYLIGTAVSIALAMTLFIIFYIKLGPVYPEYNRHRMVVIENASHRIKNQRKFTAVCKPLCLKKAKNDNIYAQKYRTTISKIRNKNKHTYFR